MQIRDEIKHLNTSFRELRKFGLLVGGVFLMLALWFLLRHKPWHPWFWAAGGLLVFFGAAVPRALKQVYIGWMTMAFVLGFVVSTVLLTIFFYLVITSIGLMARLFGKDFLSRKWSDAPSYWLLRPGSELKRPVDYEQQF